MSAGHKEFIAQSDDFKHKMKRRRGFSHRSAWPAAASWENG
jgi:hypothetical protein